MLLLSITWDLRVFRSSHSLLRFSHFLSSSRQQNSRQEHMENVVAFTFLLQLQAIVDLFHEFFFCLSPRASYIAFHFVNWRRMKSFLFFSLITFQLDQNSLITNILSFLNGIVFISEYRWKPGIPFVIEILRQWFFLAWKKLIDVCLEICVDIPCMKNSFYWHQKNLHEKIFW